jgi:hypothetical protein
MQDNHDDALNQVHGCAINPVPNPIGAIKTRAIQSEKDYSVENIF